MRLGLKIAIPQLLLLAALLAVAATAYLDASARRDEMRVALIEVFAASALSERVDRLYTSASREVLSYRIDRRADRLAGVAAKDEEAAALLTARMAGMLDARERELLVRLDEAHARVIRSRVLLVQAIDAGDEARVQARFQRWRIHVALQNAIMDDLVSLNAGRAAQLIDRMEREAFDLVRLAVFVLLAAAALVVATYGYMGRAVIRPLDALSGGIARFGEGELGARIDGGAVRRRDEIGKLARAFNRMAGQLEDLNRGLERKVRERTAQLEAANRELEAFSYSASHDLRAPLQTIDGFSRALEEDYGERLDAEGRDFLQRVRRAAQHMAQLIDDLLKLSRVSRVELASDEVDLSALAQEVVDGLREREPQREVEVDIAPGVVATGDRRLLRAALENLLGNAWKFTSARSGARIAFGAADEGGERVYCVRDNGAGFDMARAGKLFVPFQRLHNAAEFPGSGIGLATVRRIIQRHGGRVWAEGAVGEGATFRFTIATEAADALPAPPDLPPLPAGASLGGRA